MDSDPVTPDKPTMPAEASDKWRYIVTAIAAVVVFAILYVVYNKRPQQSEADPLCQSIGKIRLKCVVGLASEGLLGPGHFVDYPPSAPAEEKVPFPNGDLFSKTCLVPGSQVKDLLEGLKNQEQRNSLALDEVTYKLDRSLTAGADLPVPRLANLQLKAGPKLAEVQGITFKAQHAWLKMIDENTFIDLLAHSGISELCIDNIIAKHYRVVSKAAIAGNVEVVITDKSGNSLGLSAAASKDQIAVTAGGDASTSVDETIKQASTTPVVIGVDFFDPEIFMRNRAQLVMPSFLPTGKTTIVAKTSAGPARFIDAPLGEKASLAAAWRIGSCNAPEPFAQVSAALSPESSKEHPDRQAINFSATGTIAGGWSGVFGENTLICRPNSVRASLGFESEVKTVVRSTSAKVLTVEFSGLPGTTNVEVKDWSGHTLPETRREGGILEFDVPAAGVYSTRITGTLDMVSLEGRPERINDSGKITVSVH